MARTGEPVCVKVLLVIALAVWLDSNSRAVEAQQFGVYHRYAHLDGSSAKSGGGGMSPDYIETLKAHDRRRLASVLNLPLNGSYFSTGLYYTQLSLGTPPRQYTVMMDTGSHVTWVHCVPCSSASCPLQSNIPGVKLSLFDPKLSSTAKALPCASVDCEIASFGDTPVCTDPVSPGACSYEVQYVDGSATSGYLLNDVMTLDLVVNGTNTVTTANVYFGCGHNLTGGSSLGVDGLMGFGQAPISIPTQLATQKKTGRVFGHCLQGDDPGGGIFVIGNITELDVVYTPIVQGSLLYHVGMQNIAVNGTNSTTPASFDLKPNGGGGVVVDSGSTLALLIQPAYDHFEAAISRNAPVPLQYFQDPSGSKYSCFVYSGSTVGAFPEVTLFFDGGAVMNLGPSNYLLLTRLDGGETAYCIAWLPSAYFTILGDIVLKDQLVVYDNDQQRVGWKPFDCTKSISVDNGTNEMAVLPPLAPPPGSPLSGGASSGGQRSRTGMSTFFLSSCLAFAFLHVLRCSTY